MKKILFITHAGKTIGGGHLSRCFALSQGLAEQGFASCWLLNEEAKEAARSLGIQDAHFADDPFHPDALAQFSGWDEVAAVVVDSYGMGERFCAALNAKMPAKIVLIADNPGYAMERYAALVVDYSLSAGRKGYAKKERADYLLGAQYALLRKIFWNMETQEGDDVLLIPGAADVMNVGATLIQWWEPEWPALQVVSGPFVSRGRKNALVDAAKGKKNVTVLDTPDDLPNRMACAGIVLCTASVTMYEALALRKKTAVFAVAENQMGDQSFLSDGEAVCDLGFWGSVGKRDMEKVFRFQPNRQRLDDLVNPRGAILCAEQIIAFIVYNKLFCRAATFEDRDLLFAWANDPQTRENAHNKEPIRYDTHVAWLKEKLASPDSWIFLILNENTPVGLLRLDGKEPDVILSYTVAPEWRGKGIGTKMIAMLPDIVQDEKIPCQKIVADVYKHNIASAKIFQNAGYEMHEKDRCYIFTLSM